MLTREISCSKLKINLVFPCTMYYSVYTVYINREYYMVARKHDIYFECEQERWQNEILHGKYVIMYNHTWSLIG